MLVDALIAVEMFAFAHETVPADTGSPEATVRRSIGLSAKSALEERHVFKSFLVGQLAAAALLLGIAFVVGVPLRSVVGNVVADGSVGILVGLWLLLLVGDTILLPFRWKSQKKARNNLRGLILAMTHTYEELAHGSVSTRRVREVATKAADSGVVWPGPLFAILDDNIARGGSL